MGTLQKLDSNDPSLQRVTGSTFAILDSFVDPAVVINDEGTMLFFNKSSEELFGYTRMEMLGRDVKMLMPEPFKSEHDSYLANYQRSGVSHIMGIGRGKKKFLRKVIVDVPIQKKDGSIAMMHLKLNKQEIGGKMYYTGMFTKAQEKQKGLSPIEQEKAVLKGEIPSFKPIVTARYDYSRHYYRYKRNHSIYQFHCLQVVWILRRGANKPKYQNINV